VKSIQFLKDSKKAFESSQSQTGFYTQKELNNFEDSEFYRYGDITQLFVENVDYWRTYLLPELYLRLALSIKRSNIEGDGQQEVEEIKQIAGKIHRELLDYIESKARSI